MTDLLSHVVCPGRQVERGECPEVAMSPPGEGVPLGVERGVWENDQWLFFWFGAGRGIWE